jgi:trehalose 6-phosphate synthase
MKTILRFALPLLAVLGLLAWVAAALAERLTTYWALRDLEFRDRLVVSTISGSLAHLAAEWPDPDVMLAMMTRATRDERLLAMGLCGPDGKMGLATESLPPDLDCATAPRPGSAEGPVVALKTGPAHVLAFPLDPRRPELGDLLVVHDLSYLSRRVESARGYIFWFFALLGAVVSAVTVGVARLSLRRWAGAVREAVTRAESSSHPAPAAAGEIQPIVEEVRALVRELRAGVRDRDDSLVTWGPGVLREVIERELASDEVITVSNREPYIHFRRADGTIEVRFPASGLVSALEPVMRACGGTWVAHGSGDADREVVDASDRVRVPPDEPAYTLRRVWLTPEEEQGYYYGFANEGLWPLCHLAHARPVFRGEDWAQYRRVNQRFADAIAAEARSDDPIVLVQDYHFALLPRLVQERLPAATVITFWHIPWPNPEAFGICPWREAILDGMLGSTILGFHTRFHCNNFVDTVDRVLESRIDREYSTISYQGRTTLVQHYPISIEWPSRWLRGQPPVAECRRRLREANGLPQDARVGVGVDRLDYTKGIVERLRAVERLLETHPEWVGRFAFVQIAAPSRSAIERYRHFAEEVVAVTAAINARFAHPGYTPVQLRVAHHSPPEVFEYYRGADLCFVSSLHDGMNLVAKEFVAARDDEEGVLVLSLFAGASRELPEALVVNPYDTDECARALHRALAMPVDEQRSRMRRMREYVQEYNIYRWAGRMLMDAARIRARNRLLSRCPDLSAS